jgi:[ribosomal protein S5]-alanine N-acetyltransferase
MTISIPPYVTIQTTRLFLREFTLADAPDLFHYAHLTEVTRFVEWEPPESVYESEELIQRYIGWQFEAPRRHLVLAITWDGRLVGDIGLTASGQKESEAELGFAVDPAYWGQGVATEAAGAVVAYGFTTAGCNRITAICDVDNAASAAVLRKIGLQQEAYLPRHKYKRGEWRHSLVFSATRGEWAEPDSPAGAT